MIRLIRQIVKNEKVLQLVMCGLHDYEVRVINKTLRDLEEIVNFRNLRDAKEHLANLEN